MRVTGSGIPGHLLLIHCREASPKTITVKAAAGYSSYGNQIGLATGEVKEYYHPGFVAKRMEIGAVVAAAPADHVLRKEPVSGDVVILLGGKTGRDGCGGATDHPKSFIPSPLKPAVRKCRREIPLQKEKFSVFSAGKRQRDLLNDATILEPAEFLWPLGN